MTVDYVMAPSATLAAAQRAIAAAIEEAEALAVDVCIAVTDGAGTCSRWPGWTAPRCCACRSPRTRRIRSRPSAVCPPATGGECSSPSPPCCTAS